MSVNLRLYSGDLVSRHGFGVDSPPESLLEYVGLIQGDEESIERHDRVWSAWKRIVPTLVERYMLPELAKNGYNVEIVPALWMNHNCVQASRINDLRPDYYYGWQKTDIRMAPEYVEVPMEAVLAVVLDIKDYRL